MQADVALHERMEQRMMAKVRAAEQALLDGEFNILASSPLGRAQVERFAALNARIQELEGMLGPGAKVTGLFLLFLERLSHPPCKHATDLRPAAVHRLILYDEECMLAGVGARGQSPE